MNNSTLGESSIIKKNEILVELRDKNNSDAKIFA